METRLRLDILPQPDETTCGPTCLHAVYRYFGDEIPLETVVKGTRRLENGGTLAVMLACHALKRGYTTTLYTYNLQMFDPTWFEVGMGEVRAKLAAQADFKTRKRLKAATEAYLEYLDLGGKLAFEDLTDRLISRYLSRGIPILTGLSATYLYRAPREFGPDSDYDDIRGEPAGHFVVLTGYDPSTGKILVADPLHPNPWFESHLYEIDVQRVICSILLGILTYDDTLLIIEPPSASARAAAQRGAAATGASTSAPPAAPLSQAAATDGKPQPPHSGSNASAPSSAP